MNNIFIFIIMIFFCTSNVTVQAEENKKVVNLLEKAPYNENSMGKRMLVNKKDLLMMQAALKPEQKIPQHKANSNVHIIILEGNVVITLAGKDITAKKGDLVPVAFKTVMSIKNKSKLNATFVIIKTPNPSEMDTGDCEHEK